MINLGLSLQIGNAYVSATMALDHYISQVHLRGFYSPVLVEFMYAICKRDLKQFTPNSKVVCRLDEGSTNEYLNEPRAIEEFLIPVENKYNAAVTALQENRLTKETIYVVAGFASYVLSCSPAAMRINAEPLKGSLEAIAKLLEKNNSFPLPPPELGGKSLGELLESGKIKFEIDPKYPQAIGIANIFQRVSTLGNCKWTILINEHDDCPFFTSDFPVGNVPTRNPYVVNRVVPLSPKIAVRFQPDTSIDRNTLNFEFDNFSCDRRKITRSEAVCIKRLLVRSAEDTVFFRDSLPWVLKFVEKNRDFRVQTETVQIQQQGEIVHWSRQSTATFSRG